MTTEALGLFRIIELRLFLGLRRLFRNFGEDMETIEGDDNARGESFDVIIGHIEDILMGELIWFIYSLIVYLRF